MTDLATLWPGGVPPASTASPALLAMRQTLRTYLQRYLAIAGRLNAHERQQFEHHLLTQYHYAFPPQLMAWGYRFFPHYFNRPSSRMHRRLAELLQWKHTESQTFDAIIAPRSGAKTTWTSKLYTLYCICHSYEHYILLIGDSSEQSWQNLAAVKKELLENDDLMRAYPHACGQGARWNESYIITRNDIKVEALGTRKKVRGRAHGPYRPGLIIIDDLENDEAVQSATQREKVYRWLNRALLPAGSDDCNVLFVGTALHPEDALQRIRRSPGWKLESFAALISEPQRQELWDEWRTIYRNLSLAPVERQQRALSFFEAHRAEMEAGTELLWPEKEPLYDLMRWREDKGETAFQAEKQGNAAATGATEFSSELFHSAIWFDIWPDLRLKALALDPSKGQHEHNDYSAYVWGGLADDGRIYVDADLERRDASQVVRDGIRIYRRFLPQLFGIESVMFLSLFGNIFEAEARAQQLLIPLTQLHPRLSKIVRIRQLTPYLKSDRLRFKAGSRGAEMLVDQLKWFPTGRHDDGPDALQMLLQLLAQLSGQPPLEPEFIVT